MQSQISPAQSPPDRTEPSAASAGPSVDSEITWLLHRAAQRMRGATGEQADKHGIQLRDYIVLSALDLSPIRTQAALAESIGADKTRIIPTLDKLQERRYIERIPDPEDRRARLLAITESGRSVKNAAQVDIQRSEERWLGELSADDRSIFLRVLRQLTFGS